MTKVSVRLQPLVRNLNLPTVMKTAILPGDSIERLFIATQVGEIFYIGNDGLKLFLDIRSRIIRLGEDNGGYDERGLVGLAFHPQFYYNGLFYLHYSVAGSQGPGPAPGGGEFDPFEPDPCDPATLNLKWENRETQHDHIDTVEEWMFQPNGQPRKHRTLLQLRRPFSNHNGINSLTFSPETGKLVLTTGDGGSGYDPFNLSQDPLEIAGKIVEIDVAKHTYMAPPPVVTRFDELPLSIQETLSVTVKGLRNPTGISYQKYYNHYIKYVGNVGQDLVESIYSFLHYRPIPVTQLTQAAQEGLINFGWRAWEGDFPTMILTECSTNPDLSKKTMAYYEEAVKTSVQRLQPLISYYHEEPRPDKFVANSLTGVQPYMGTAIPQLSGCIVFSELVRGEDSERPARGALAYTHIKSDCKLNDFSVLKTEYDFGDESAYYVSLGTNQNQTRLYVGVYNTMQVTKPNQGTVFEMVPC